MLALERGPIVYCLEGKDQPGGTVFDKYIPEGTAIEASYVPDLLGGIVVLSGKAGDVPFKAIPYSTWNNRGPDQMAVWIPASEEYATPVPEPTIASKAKAYDGNVPAWGVNDQWEPRSSSDIDKPYFYWWLKKAARKVSLTNSTGRTQSPAYRSTGLTSTTMTGTTAYLKAGNCTTGTEAHGKKWRP